MRSLTRREADLLDKLAAGYQDVRAAVVDMADGVPWHNELAAYGDIEWKAAVLYLIDPQLVTIEHMRQKELYDDNKKSIINELYELTTRPRLRNATFQYPESESENVKIDSVEKRSIRE